MNGKVLVTGGAGYIGTHVVVRLLQARLPVVIFDSLCNSSRLAVARVTQITGKGPEFVLGDVRDAAALQRVFQSSPILAVVHLAGLKAVHESQAQPLVYYDNNVAGSLVLLREMQRANVRTLVFSSSATVYGAAEECRYSENTALAPMNVYGRSKLMVEDMLRDLKQAESGWRIAILRYFNPVGAHASGLIGEDPAGPPNNLMPYIAQVAVGKRPRLAVFGGDYPTHDGTALRDYIHVDDLAAGHLAAMRVITRQGDCLLTVNLGTGRPYSVLEVINAFRKVSGKPIPFDIVGRRNGDLAEYYADPSLAKTLLGWEATQGIERMCVDAWRWQSMNPDGYSV